MKSFFNSVLLEKAFILLFLFVFFIFAVFFTVLNLKETENDFNNQRLNYTKKLAEEIRYLIENRTDISYKLSNALAQNSVSYAVVHFSDGTLLARSEGYALPVGIFETAEANALQAQFLNLFPFKDPSGRFSIVEASIPIYTNEGIRYILRLGFLRTTEEEKISSLKLRNTLIFSLIFIFFISVRNIHYFSYLNLRYVLLITMTLVMLILFFSSSYFIREWSVNAWRDNFISNECINLSKMLIPSAKNLIESGSSEISSFVRLLKDNKDFEMLSVIKDDVYVYHSDASKIGAKVTGEYYRKSLNTEKSSVFKNGVSEDYIAMIPVMNEKNRVGTICTVWKNYNAFESFSSLRNKLTFIFVFAYLLMYWFISRFTSEFSKLIQNTANNKDEIAFLHKTLENNKESADKNLLSVSVFVYFSGILEAVEKADKEALKQSVEDCYSVANSLLKDKSSNFINLESNGISILFKDENEQNSVYEAINYSRKLKEELNKHKDLAFSPKITLHICKMIYIKDDNNKDKYRGYFGDSKIDYKTIAKVQSRNDIIVSEETYNFLKELIKFETMELLSLEQGKFNVYVLGEFNDPKELFDKYHKMSEWTKLMILRILKDSGEFDTRVLNELKENNKS